MSFEAAIRRWEQGRDMVRFHREWLAAYEARVSAGTRKAEIYSRCLRYFSKLNADERYWR